MRIADARTVIVQAFFAPDYSLARIAAAVMLSDARARLGKLSAYQRLPLVLSAEVARTVIAAGKRRTSTALNLKPWQFCVAPMMDWTDL